MAAKLSNKWFFLGIDLITIAVSFVLAYIIRFNLTLSFDVSILAYQLPVIVLIALVAFRITGSYKGVLGGTTYQNVYNIVKAICLSSALIIMLVIINRSWEIYPDFSIPLSIIIIYSLLSFVGLVGSHYLFRVLHNAILRLG